MNRRNNHRWENRVGLRAKRRRQSRSRSHARNRRLLMCEALEARLLLAGEPRLTGAAPLPGEGGSVTDLIERIDIQTSEDFAAAGVNDPASWELRSAGADHVFGSGDDVLYDLYTSPAYTAGTAITLEISGGPLPLGSYRFTARSSGLGDTDGNPLDGNGDGTGGDDFVRNFHVANSPGFVLEQEDNNTYTYATALSVVEDPAGSGFHVGYALGRLDATADVDYWRFDALEGDRITIAVDTPDSGLNPWISFRTVADSQLANDYDFGPGLDSQLAHYTVDTAGRYLVRVASSGGTGRYELRVDTARGTTQLEQDANYANDTLATANVPAKQVSGQDVTVSIAGTIMATAPGGGPDYANVDEDYFALGELNAGNQVQLGLRLPGGSVLDGRVRLVDSAGAAVADTDGELNDADFQAAIPAAGSYYALVEANAGAGHRGSTCWT